MLLRALPYVLVWLDAVFLFIDPTPLRALLALAGVAAAGATRFAAGRPALVAAALVGAAAIPVALLLTAASTAGLVRALVAAMGGTFAIYCTMRAVRG